jgi:predicted PilT family ATPase
MKRIIENIKRYIKNTIDARIDVRIEAMLLDAIEIKLDSIDKVISKKVDKHLEEIDFDNEVSTRIEDIDWSCHIDYSELAENVTIDYYEMGKQVEIDTACLAEEMMRRMHFDMTVSVD